MLPCAEPQQVRSRHEPWSPAELKGIRAPAHEVSLWADGFLASLCGPNTKNNLPRQLQAVYPVDRPRAFDEVYQRSTGLPVYQTVYRLPRSTGLPVYQTVYRLGLPVYPVD